MHKAKWGSIDALHQRTMIMEPHLYSASVASINDVEESPAGDRQTPMFWRSKTRCSSYAEWMELHDAADGAVLWRAEARYSDRAAPVVHREPSGHERTEFLTVVRLYLENEKRPRLMIVHRDRQPAGIKCSTASRTLSVYTLDHSEEAAGSSSDHGREGRQQTREQLTEEDVPVDQFDFANLPAGEDMFQLVLNSTLTTLSLTAMQMSEGTRIEAPALSTPSVRTLARMKRATEHSERRIEVHSGLDVPLVSMLLACIDQLLLSHEAVDYDVAWPVDYGFSGFECFSSRKAEPDKGSSTTDAKSTKHRSCFSGFGFWLDAK